MSSQVNVIRATTQDQIPTAVPQSGLILAYWDIRGLCQPIRLALAYKNVKYTDVRIDCGNPADKENYKKLWFDVKPEVGKTVKFVNLPYLMDGDGDSNNEKVAISQSQAILRYVGRKYNLMGTNEVVTDVLLSEVYDFDSAFTGMCYRNFGQMKEYCQTKLPKMLDMYAEQLALFGNTFIAGKEVSIVDFKFYELLSKWKIVESDVSIATNCIGSNKAISTYIERMEKLAGVKEYIESDVCIRRPINNAHAMFK